MFSQVVLKLQPHVLDVFFCVGSNTIFGRGGNLTEYLLCGWLYRLNIIATSGIDRDFEVSNSNVLDHVTEFFHYCPSPHPEAILYFFFLIAPPSFSTSVKF